MSTVQLMRAVYYRAPDRSEPVKEYIAALPTPAQVILYGQIELLNRLSTTDPPLPHPRSSQVDGPLRELRCHYGRLLYRVFYQRSEGLFVLLHIIQKNTDRLPQGDIDIAKARWEAFTERMNADPRRPPRAAGHDAP